MMCEIPDTNNNNNNHDETVSNGRPIPVEKRTHRIKSMPMKSRIDYRLNTRPYMYAGRGDAEQSVATYANNMPAATLMWVCRPHFIIITMLMHDMRSEMRWNVTMVRGASVGVRKVRRTINANGRNETNTNIERWSGNDARINYSCKLRLTPTSPHTHTHYPACAPNERTNAKL